MSTIDRERAHAKLTRSLRIEGRRPDGYHLLRAEMVTIDLADAIEFTEGDGLEVRDGLNWLGQPGEGALEPVPSGEENLVARALRRVGRRAHVVLEKHIPHGGGLGGGSADAAAVLRWAGEIEPALAVELGADVPFCVRGGRALVSGVGEVVEQLADEALCFVLYTPELALSTKRVYDAFDELGVGDRSISVNDLERAALAVEPELGRARDLVADVCGRRPQLAGSGSTWFLECAPAEQERLVGELKAAAARELGRAIVTSAAAVGASL